MVVAAARLAGFDVVYSAHVSPYGAVPATLQRRSCHAVDVHVLHLDDAQVAAIDAYEPNYQRRRLEVKPGMTGWAQVNGRAGIPWEERIELDVWYVDHRSARLDLRILARTLRLLASGHGLYG